MIPTASARPRFTKFKFILLAAGVPAATALYAAFIEPAWIEVTRHSIPTKTNATPLVIAQLSDLHLRKISRTENRVLQILRKIEPHLLILSGDVIESPAGFPALENFLGRLGPMEKIAVLGNWEHWGGIDLARLKATYTRHRVRLLINERADLLLEKRPISVIGSDDLRLQGHRHLDPAPEIRSEARNRGLRRKVTPTGAYVLALDFARGFEDLPVPTILQRAAARDAIGFATQQEHPGQGLAVSNAGRGGPT